MLAYEVSANPKQFMCGKCDCNSNHESPIPNKWEIPGVIKTNKCPRWMVTEQDVFLLEMYAHYKNGVLPFGGGLLNQPNLYVEAMGVIDDYARSVIQDNRARSQR